MPTTLQFRRYDTANIANTTGAVGEIFIDTDKETVVVQDGSTAGGFALAREGAYDQANTARDTANDSYGQANAAYDQANTARDTANDSYGQANTAYDQANTARSTANDAYNDANTRVLKAGDTMTGNLNVAATIISQNIIPNLNVTYDLGTSEYRFKDLWLSNSSLHLGEATLSAVGDEVRIAKLNVETLSDASGINVASQSIDAYNQANTARDTANDSYGQANTARDTANTAYDAANNAKVTVFANSGAANVTTQIINFVNTSTILVAVANTNSNANVELLLVGTPYDQANTARDTANDSYGQANTARNQANTARNTANGAYEQANGAYGQANGAYAHANIVYAQANSAYDQANASRDQANTAYGQANDAYGQANTARDTANDAYSQANSARDQANTAYAEANLKLNIAGGTINGSLNVSGNLSITGNTTYYNVTTYSVDDPLIYLAANNDTSDLVDIGFMGGHNTAGVYQHSGLARDAGDGTWYLFTGLADEGHENNIVDFANTTLATLRANINANSILLTGESVATQANLTLAHNQANTARDQANTARGTANDSYGQANSARDQANTARDQANNAYAEANLKLNLSGGTVTGDITLNGNVNLATNSTFKSNTVATVTQDVEVTVDAFSSSAYRSALYQAQLTRTSPDNDYEAITISVVHDGTTVYLSQYGQNKTNASANMGTFDASIAAGVLSLKFTPNVNVVTVKTQRSTITV